MRSEMRRALAHVRSGRGPILLEALTYRRMGHSSSDDPTRYRDADEVATWERRDPIERMRKYLRSRRWLSKADEERMEEELHQKISAAVDEVEKQPEPGLETLVEDVYATPTPALQEQRLALLEYVRSAEKGPNR